MSNDIEEKLRTAEENIIKIQGEVSRLDGLFDKFFKLILWVPFIYVAVLGVLYHNSYSENRDFKNDVLRELGKEKSIPQLTLCTSSREKLHDSDITVEIKQEEDGVYLEISYIIYNNGNGASGPLVMKIYTNDPIDIEVSSTSSKYKYSMLLGDPKDRFILPGNCSTEYYNKFKIKSLPPNGKYPSRLEVYYGNGLVEGADVNLVVQGVTPS